jgi:hypothetical protein
MNNPSRGGLEAMRKEFHPLEYIQIQQDENQNRDNNKSEVSPHS